MSEQQITPVFPNEDKIRTVLEIPREIYLSISELHSDLYGNNTSMDDFITYLLACGLQKMLEDHTEATQQQ